MTEFLGGKNWGPVVVGRRLFKIMASLSLISFLVLPVSDLKEIILVDFLSHS